MKRTAHLVAFALALTAQACEQAAAGDSNAAAAGNSNAAPVVIETGECGARGQKDCPTQRWMKATLQSYLRGGDFERLAAALDTLAAKEPTGFTGWRDIAEQGAKAARNRDEATVRQSCKDCHDSLRDRFKGSLRQHVLFGS